MLPGKGKYYDAQGMQQSCSDVDESPPGGFDRWEINTAPVPSADKCKFSCNSGFTKSESLFACSKSTSCPSPTEGDSTSGIRTQTILVQLVPWRLAMPVTTTPKTRHNANRRRHASTRLQTLRPEQLVLLRLTTPLLRQRRSWPIPRAVLTAMPVIGKISKEVATFPTSESGWMQRKTPKKIVRSLPTLTLTPGLPELPMLQTNAPFPVAVLIPPTLRRESVSPQLNPVPSPTVAERKPGTPKTTATALVQSPLVMPVTTTPKTRHNANRRRRTFTRLQTIMPEPTVLRRATPLLRQGQDSLPQTVVLPVMMQDTTTPKTRHNANRRRRTFTRLQTIMPEPTVLRRATPLLRQGQDSLPQTVVLPVMMQDTTTPKTRHNANRRRLTFTRLQMLTPEPPVLLCLTTPPLR